MCLKKGVKMDRHLLITISEQKSALNGVRFAGDFFEDKTNIKATLFYATPKASMVLDNEKSLENINRQRKTEEMHLEKGKQAVEDAAEILLQKGFAKENIILKARTQVFSKIADIIQEGEIGAYDAVVIGRRGISMLEEAFEESVSKALFKETIAFPLWLCNASNKSEKDILLYVDGTSASFQMADHIGFVLSESLQHKINIIAPENIFSDVSLMGQYKEAICKNGVSAERVGKISSISGNPAKAILKMTEKGAYAAVAMGKTAENEGNIFSRLFRGPVCSTLFKEMRNTSLWLCP